MQAISHDELVRRSFEQQTALFTGREALFAQRSESTLSWVEPLDADMIVLDVACGAAHVADAIAPHVRQVVGVDLTPTLLTLGADRLRAAGIENVLLQEGNAEELPFVDDSFDLVVCRASLHHFSDPERPLREMARVCRPQGRVVISDMIAPSEEVRQSFDELHITIDPSHVRALVEHELAELVAATVGSLTHGSTSTTGPFPVEVMLTDAGDRDAAMRELRTELAGGRPTGFEPIMVDNRVHVRFTSTVVHANVTD
jgi:ubiquinone/menaquinone biosynthesis C-methylase UbiE